MSAPPPRSQRFPRIGDDFKATCTVQIDHVMVHCPFIFPLLRCIRSHFLHPGRTFNFNERVVGAIYMPRCATPLASGAHCQHVVKLDSSLVLCSVFPVSETNCRRTPLAVKIRLCRETC